METTKLYSYEHDLLYISDVQTIEGAFEEAIEYGTDLSGLALSHTYLKRSILENAKLGGAKFYKCDFFKVDFSGANLTGATFDVCTLSFPILWATYLRRTVFQHCKLHGFFPLYTYRGGMFYRNCIWNGHPVIEQEFDHEGGLLFRELDERQEPVDFNFPAA